MKNKYFWMFLFGNLCVSIACFIDYGISAFLGIFGVIFMMQIAFIAMD